MRKVALALAIVMLGAFASESALAGGHSRVTVGIGVGFPGYWGGPYYGGYWGPRYYAPYPYYYPAAVGYPYPAAPTVYVEQGGATAAPAPAPAQPQGYWYYCAGPQTYYPYVQQCPEGWQRVIPQTPPGG